MTSTQQTILSQVQQQAEELLSSSPRCHDLDHTLRVVENSRRLWKAEGGDLFIIECAALLHDIGRGREFASRGKHCHAVLGAEQVPEIIRKAGLTDDKIISRITECVISHRYRGHEKNGRPASIEAKIVYDADKLDSMGAIGIGRAFHFAGRIGARVHNRQEEALNNDSYTIEDTAFREYLVKLRYLQKRLLTAEGRRIGEQRSRFMEVFFQCLLSET